MSSLIVLYEELMERCTFLLSTIPSKSIAVDHITAGQVTELQLVISRVIGLQLQECVNSTMSECEPPPPELYPTEAVIEIERIMGKSKELQTPKHNGPVMLEEPVIDKYESRHGTHVGNCECCNSQVYDSLCDEEFIKANPNLPAEKWDYWVYCINPKCKHHYGVGYEILNNDNRRYETGVTTDMYPWWVE
jgi:hypothetical protein